MSSKSAAGARPLAVAPPRAGRQRGVVHERDRILSDPQRFRELDREQQSSLVAWIRDVLVPAKTVFRRNSYGMKHDFEKDKYGFYICNGAFKGAMKAAGFPPEDPAELMWRFRVRPAQPLSRWEQLKYRKSGSGWLVRDYWREVGYRVLRKTQYRRMLAHAEECTRERLPQVMILSSRYTADIVLDMAPAGYRLTPEAVAEIVALSKESAPRSRRRFVVDEQSAAIPSVPGHRAEAVAAALVRIAKGCSQQQLQSE